MSTFRVHEDLPSCLVENNKPHQEKKPVKTCFEKNRQRGVLQPLPNHQQNSKRLKPETGKENSIAVLKKSDITDLDKRVVATCKDVIALKPSFKRFTLSAAKPVLAGEVETEYQDDILTYLSLLEKNMYKIKPLYMNKQVYLNWNMRSVLVDWLVSVADEYQLSNQTVHLSVNYLDRFLSNISVIRDKFQLVGATAMMIAGKMEDIYPPDVKEWSYLTGDTFTTRQIIKMEQLMLKVLNFEMNTPTTLEFIKHICAKLKLDTKTMHLAMYISELVLLEGECYLQHYPSKLAAACLVLARHTLFKAKPWTKKLEEVAGYTLKQLSPVVQKQQTTFKSSPFKEQQAIQKKYASDKYQRVALLKPRILALDDEE